MRTTLFVSEDWSGSCQLLNSCTSGIRSVEAGTLGQPHDLRGPARSDKEGIYKPTDILGPERASPPYAITDDAADSIGHQRRSCRWHSFSDH